MSKNNQDLSNTCGCCEGTELATPLPLDNEAGLTNLTYRVGTHSAFKEAMLSGLSKTAELHALTTREDNDPSIALIDAWAVVLDVLTFYQERIIDEGYVRTAKERLSLFELAKHINYIPKPGVAAGSWLAFKTDTAPGSPTETQVDKGTKVQSIPGKDEKPQIFETSETFEAKTKWNAIKPKLKTVQNLEEGLSELYLEGTNNQVQIGDKILFIGADRLSDSNSKQWEIHTLKTVETHTDNNYTLVTWQTGLKYTYAIPNPPSLQEQVFVFRQRAALFGHNAPDWKVMSKEVKKTFDSTNWDTRTEWPNFDIQNPSLRAIDLDQVYPKILKDSWLALVMPNQIELFQAKNVSSSARNDYALASKTTLLKLDTDENLSSFELRETLVLAQSEVLNLAQKPIYTPVFGKSILLDKIEEDLKIGQTIILSGEELLQVQVTPQEPFINKETGAEIKPSNLLFVPKSGASYYLKTGDILVLNGVPEELSSGKFKWQLIDKDLREGYLKAHLEDLTPFKTEENTAAVTVPSSLNQADVLSEVLFISDLKIEDNCTRILFETPLQTIYLRDTVSLNANTAYATHGETRTEILGSGDGSKMFQKFLLKQQPLTYVSSTSTSGIASTLEVRVNDIRWKEVPTFYNRKPEERIYISRQEDDGSTYIQFGNGITGARLPSGLENIKATYRVGIGFEGLLKAQQLSMLLTPQLGLRSVYNPIPTTGADEPESWLHIRQNAPLTTLTLDRIVSIQDYEDFANAFASIGKARADLLWKGEDRVVHLTVASADGEAVSPTLNQNLLGSINQVRHDNFNVVINTFQLITFSVVAKISIHPDFLAEQVTEQVLKDLTHTFSFNERKFGQGLTPSEVMAIIQSVAGVISVDLDSINGQSPFSKPHFRLISNVARWQGQEISPAQLLLIDVDNINISVITSR